MKKILPLIVLLAGCYAGLGRPVLSGSGSGSGSGSVKRGDVIGSFGISKVIHSSELSGGGTTASPLTFTSCGSSGQTWVWNGSAFVCTSVGSGSGSVTNVATGTGLTGGPITTTGTISLANTAVTPGSYTLTNLTADAQGRITAASSYAGTTAPADKAITALSAAGAGTFAYFYDSPGTGLATGATGNVVKLADTLVTPGSYTYSSITVDQQGRITAASSGTAPVTSVGVSAPITTTGGLTPTIGIALTSNLRNNGGSLDLATAVSMPGSLVVQSLAGTVVSPTSFSTQQDDYNPTSLSTATVLRLNCTNAGGCTITGIQGGTAGRELVIQNIGSNQITLANQNTGSTTAGDRFITSTGADMKLAADMSGTLSYDGTTSRWRLVSYDVPNGSGLAWSGGQLTYDSAVIQSRVSGTCSDPFGIVSIASNGTVTCSTTTIGGTLAGSKLVSSSGAHTVTDYAGSTGTACTSGNVATNAALSSAGVVTTTCQSLATQGIGTSNLTNSAGNNVIPKSNGTNLVASSISDNGTTVSTAEAVSVGTVTSAVTVAGATGRVDAMTVNATQTGTSTSGDGPQLHFANASNYNAFIAMVNTATSPSFLNPKLSFYVQNSGTTGTGNVTDIFDITNGGAKVLSGGLDMGSLKITNCANGTVSSDGACFGQIASGVNAAVSGTSGRVAVFNGTNSVTGYAGFTSDSSGNVTTNTLTNVNNTSTGQVLVYSGLSGTTIDDALKVGNSTGSTTSADVGWSVGVNRSGGNITNDTKLGAGGAFLFRIGSGTSNGFTNTWLQVDGTAAVQLSKSGILTKTLGTFESAGAATLDSTAHIVGNLTEDGQIGINTTPSSSRWIDARDTGTKDLALLYHSGGNGTYGAGQDVVEIRNDDQTTSYALMRVDVANLPTKTMRFTSDGRLGIGLTAPAYTLDVNGTAHIVGALTEDGNSTFTGSHTNSVADVTISDSATGQTIASARQFDAINTGTFNTTGGTITTYGVMAENSASRSAGANNLTNVAVYGNAQNGQVNLALLTDRGDVVLNNISGNFSAAVTGSGTVTLGTSGGTSTTTVNGNTTITGGTSGTPLSITDATQATERLRFTGQEWWQAANTSTDGPAMLLGINRTGRREFWLVDSASESQSASHWALALTTNSNTPSLGMYVTSTDGSVFGTLYLQSPTGLATTAPTVVGGSLDVLGGVLDMNSHQINNVTDPSSDQDAMTLNYWKTHAPNEYANKHYEWNDDWMVPFTTLTASDGKAMVGQVHQLVGSGATMTAAPLSGVNTRPGMVALAKGTSSSATDYIGFVSSNQAVNFGDGNWSYQWVGGVSATSSTGPTVSSAYNMLIGFYDTPTSIDQVDGCYFLYDVPNRATGGQNAGNAQDLEAVCVSNSVRTVYLLNGTGTCDASFAKGTAAVGAWANSNTNIMNLKVSMIGTTEADFFYNGTQVCKITTNIPTNSSLRMTGFGFEIMNDASTAAADKQMYTDYTSAVLDMTSARSP